MKNLIVSSLVVFVVGLFAPHISQAQGTTYFSNLSQPSAGSLSVGNDLWRTALFTTGTNLGAYVLNSIQLKMTTASGNPSGFAIMIYTNFSPFGGGGVGRNFLGSLTSSVDPVTAGTYTFTPSTTISLQSGDSYYIVVTAGTTAAAGAYNWNFASVSSYSASDGWRANINTKYSGNGSSWISDSSPFYLQFAINASPIPEPSSLVLMLFGGVVLFQTCRRHEKPDR